jgi:hypothetical protein
MPDILTVNTMRKSYSGAEEFNFSSPLWVKSRRVRCKKRCPLYPE